MFTNLKKGLLASSVAASALFTTGVVTAADMLALLLPENVNPRW